jgi:hypothetical protein
MKPAQCLQFCTSLFERFEAQNIVFDGPLCLNTDKISIQLKARFEKSLLYRPEDLEREKSCNDCGDTSGCAEDSSPS